MNISEAFEKRDFVERFEQRREADDSINKTLDEPTVWDLLPAIRGRTVVDIGCGLGHIANRLAVAGARSVVALDPSPAMIERAKARFSHDRVEFRVAHVERMDPENAFDVAVSSMVVHFVPDLPAFLAAAWRILRPGGVFVFSQRHPVRTCNPSHVSVPHDPSWQVANYFEESYRDYTWLEERVRLYHRTFETILGNLWTAGFSVDSVREPRPTLPYVQTSDRLREAELIPMVLACRCSKLRQPERPKLLALTAQVLRHLRSTAKPRS